MSDFEWPKGPDGKPLTLGQMTQDQQRAAWKHALAKVKAEFEDPARQAAMARFLASPIDKTEH